MRWIDIGRYSFDMAKVVLVERDVGADKGKRGLTISLASGKDVDLFDQEAESFLRSFSEYRAARPIGKDPPPVLTGSLNFPRETVKGLNPSLANG